MTVNISRAIFNTAFNATADFLPEAGTVITSVAGGILSFSGTFLSGTASLVINSYTVCSIASLGAGFLSLKAWGFVRDKNISNASHDMIALAKQGDFRRAHCRSV